MRLCPRCGGTGKIDMPDPMLPVPDPLITNSYEAMQWLREHVPVVAGPFSTLSGVGVPQAAQYKSVDCGAMNIPTDVHAWRILWRALSAQMFSGAITRVWVQDAPEVIYEAYDADYRPLGRWRTVCRLTIEAY